VLIFYEDTFVSNILLQTSRFFETFYRLSTILLLQSTTLRISPHPQYWGKVCTILGQGVHNIGARCPQYWGKVSVESGCRSYKSLKIAKATDVGTIDKQENVSTIGPRLKVRSVQARCLWQVAMQVSSSDNPMQSPQRTPTPTSYQHQLHNRYTGEHRKGRSS
jgi:hypothetical protein